jgi:hypothetical protein
MAAIAVRQGAPQTIAELARSKQIRWLKKLKA